MDNSIYDMARELAYAVLSTDEGKKVAETRYIFDNNEEARQKMLDYNTYREAVNMRVQEGSISQEEMKAEGTKLSQMIAELKANSIINDMVQAEGEFNAVINRVMNIFQATITGECEDENGGCTGSCGTCGGCH
ncbi:MAG: YlbF family regulator [Clostridia bacterium]|nr:YlbF family regulator [Clostridia bacterium]